MIKKVLLFLAPFLITTAAVVFYFKLTQKISAITIPNLPSISFSDLVKFSRFSLEKAPSQSLVGTITQISGEVGYESRNATEVAKINSPVSVQQGESLITGTDGSLVLIFEKAAEVDLFADTSLDVIQTLPADLVFAQTTGSVTYKKLSDIPVSIRSHHLLIENNGDISVSINKLKPIITLTVNSGSATIAYNNIYNISRLFSVTMGQTVTFNDDTRRVVVENN
ncbi:MAG TPA: hypothetical protein VKC53_01865 [Patescibacteria group bacterium]|nr:hypothetical protein [Patescibacteria group bacterium]